jgi:hypothetical protein
MNGEVGVEALDLALDFVYGDAGHMVAAPGMNETESAVRHRELRTAVRPEQRKDHEPSGCLEGIEACGRKRAVLGLARFVEQALVWQASIQ